LKTKPIGHIVCFSWGASCRFATTALYSVPITV